MRNAFRTGERIVLRPLEIEEAPLFQEWMNDPENHQYLQRFRPLNLAEERQWLGSLHEKSADHVFGIALREEERLIGTCGLHGTALPHRSGQLGILIGDKAAQGKGHGSEAIRLLLDYGFGTLGLHRVALHVYGNNERGIRCYEKCGFRREGVLREARWWAGRWWDILEYAILEQEWQAATDGEARRGKASLSPRNAVK